MIHNAYNLSFLIGHFNVDIGKIESIVEFGGGFGSMPKLIKDLGFNGKYTIFDFPEFIALQKYYLNSTHTKGNFEFIDQISKISLLDPDIFIATWSLSESPLNIRDEFLRKVGKPKYILIGYQEKFEEVDNVKYFNQYANDNKDYDWKTWEINHLPKNYYLIGKKI